MSRRRAHRLKSDALCVPPQLLAALEAQYGPLDTKDTVKLIADGVRQLHVGLTRKRKRFIADKYMRHPALRMAYSTYTVCAQAPKLVPILNRLGMLKCLNRPLKVAEFGCGPGTGVAALGLWAQQNGVDVEHLATDRVQGALDACTRLSNDLGLSGVETQLVDLKKTLARQLGPRRDFDMILLMNVLNELPTERFDLLTREFKRLLTANGIIVIVEPASMESSRHLLDARNVFIGHEWTVLAPCTHHLECPMFEDENGWCHDTWPFERPDFMVDVDRIVGTRRDSLKASWMVLSPQAPPLEQRPSLGRVISERFVEKGRERVRVCSEGSVFDLELQNRDRSDSNRTFKKVNRYDLIEYEHTIRLGRGVRLGPDSRFDILEETLDD